MPRVRSAGAGPELFRKLIDDFLDSEKFAGYKTATQISIHRTLGYAAGVLGAIPTKDIDPAYVQSFLDGLSDRPGIQENARKGLKMLERWALVRRRLSRSITLGTEVPRAQGAREPWTDQEIALAVEHCSPEMVRAVQLGSFTGQRVGDLVRMRWGDLRTIRGRLGIDLVQQKTDMAIWCPIIAEFEPILSSWKRDTLTILHKPTGIPWTGHHLTMTWYRERTKNPFLEPLNARKLSMHGLRASAVIRLRRDGLSNALIGDVVGMSEPVVNLYCRRAMQSENAIRALEIREERAANSGNLIRLHDNKDRSEKP